jgi:hypothetical protein
VALDHLAGLCGPYTDWCLINQTQSEPPPTLWAALEEHQIKPDDYGPAMRCPTATGDNFSSAPDLPCPVL